MDNAAPMLRSACNMGFSGSHKYLHRDGTSTGYCNGIDADRDRRKADGACNLLTCDLGRMGISYTMLRTIQRMAKMVLGNANRPAVIMASIFIMTAPSPIATRSGLESIASPNCGSVEGSPYPHDIVAATPVGCYAPRPHGYAY